MTGEPFLPGILDGTILVELGFGVDLGTDPDTWDLTDVTADVRMQSGISISSVGRQDEQSQGNPTTVALVLDNPTGDYTPRKADGAHWPYMTMGIPLRIGVDLGDGYVELFSGFVASIEPGWDMSGNLPTAAITAAGLLRRLQAGKTPFRSPLYRAITRAAPVAAWMLDDPEGAAVAASAVVGGGPPLVPAGDVTFGTDSRLTGGGTTPTLATDGQLSATLPAYTVTTSQAIRMWFKAPTTGGAGAQLDILHATGLGTVDTYTVSITDAGIPPAGVIVNVTKAGVIALAGDTAGGGNPTNPFDATWHELFLLFTQAGSDIMVDTYLDGVLSDTETLTGATLGQITSITPLNESFTPLFNPAYWPGPLAVYADTDAEPDYGAGDGYTGETATERLIRLCGEEGVPVTVIGDSTAAMGPQGVDTLVNLLRECEEACDGLLYDGVGFGLGLVTGPSRYNAEAALALDIGEGHLAQPLAPVEDDQKITNDVTFTRKNGSSARFIQPDGMPRAVGGPGGIGTYDRSAQANLADDSGNLDRAAWEVHKGTVDEDRYATVALDLAAVPSLAPDWLAASAGKVGFRFTITGTPPEGPTGDVDLFAEGWSSYLDQFRWTASLNCAPASPWRVFAIEDDALGRLGFDGQNLASGVDADDTTWSVASPNLPLLTTSANFPDDFPYYAEVDGEVVQITATTGSSSPQTVTVVRSVNGVVKAHTTGAVLDLYQPSVLAL